LIHIRSGHDRRMADSPALAALQAELDQVEKYEFTTHFPGSPHPPLEVDESPPVGGNHGPNPVQVLAAAVGHCMSSTLFSTLERAHVASSPFRTTVKAEVGRNANGRQRVLRMDLRIETAPLSEDDRERFQHCVSIFEDFCTVSGAVREGVTISVAVQPREAEPGRP
jgi:organic hydroperoxide reductase OsmC/OhrA